MTAPDVLSFEHTRISTHGAGPDDITVMVSQIAINGVALERYLQDLHFNDGGGVPDMPGLMSTPLLATQVPLDHRVAFLHSLCGGEWPYDQLETGRIPLGFCAQCLDSSCGMMWAAELAVCAATVTWRRLGWEDDIHEGVGWLPAPFVPEVTLTFDLNQYEAAVLAEVEYQTRAEGHHRR